MGRIYEISGVDTWAEYAQLARLVKKQSPIMPGHRYIQDTGTITFHSGIEFDFAPLEDAGFSPTILPKARR